MFPRFFQLCLAVFCSLFLCGKAAAQGLDPFGTDVPPTFSFSESVTEVSTFDADLGVDVVSFKSTLVLDAKVSMQGIDASTFDSDTPFAILLGDLSLDGFYTRLGGGFSDGDDLGPSDWVDGAGATMVTIPVNNSLTGETGVGSLTIKWTATDVSFHLSITNASEYYSIAAQALAAVDTVDPSYEAVPLLTIRFAGHELSGRTVYVQGTASVKNPDSANPLASVSLTGAIDSTSPKVTVSTPPFPTPATPVYRDGSLRVSGTATDAHGVNFVTVSVNDGAEVVADYNSLTGAWFADVLLEIGTNVIKITTTDDDDNETVVTRNAFYRPFVDLSLEIKGTGAGRLTAPFMSSALIFSPMNGTATRNGIKLEQTVNYTITATPDKSSVFAGWESNFPLADATKAVLVFSPEPGQVLTAKFAPSPAIDRDGLYVGLVQSTDPPARGTFTMKLTPGALFTGSVKVGNLTIPLKGTLDATGHFDGTITLPKGGAYHLVLTMQVVGAMQQFVGTIKGPGIDATITSDLAYFLRYPDHFPKEYGGYNGLIIPPASPTDANYPVGIGFARINVGHSWATIVGKLGDGTSFSCGSHFTQDTSLSCFAPLYTKRGSISGRLKFNLQSTTEHFKGTLDWYRPGPLPGKAATGVHGEGFSGQSTFIGSKFAPQKVLTNRVFLNSSAGAGVFSLDAPASLIAAKNLALPALTTNPDAAHPDPTISLTTVGAGSRVTLVNPTPEVQALAVKITVSASIGLFSGSFFDAVQNKRVNFSGLVAPKLNAAGGFFIRGTRTGAAQITAPTP